MQTKSIYKSAEGKQKIIALYDKVVSEWPVSVDQLKIPTGYGETFVLASGDKNLPPLILIHGSASNSMSWGGDVGTLSQNFCVYAIDIPGEPGKSVENRFSWTGPAFNEWLDEVLGGLNLKKVFLGGISLGAWAAAKFAIEFPERVEKLVLICPSGIYPARFSFLARAIGYSLLGKWGQARLKEFIFKNTPLSEDAEQFVTLVGEYFNYRLGAPPLFKDEELKKLKMPVFYMAGVNDVLLDSGKTAERLQKFLPNLDVNLYEEKGHAVVNMAKEIIDFL